MSSNPAPRLFIVDDEPALMNALCRTLREEGYETRGFTSANAALAALPQAGCDLLLADLMMPEMDGIALLRAAQAIDAALVGIIMTGEGTVASAVQAMQAGALDFIIKPFNLTAILPVLQRALAVRRLRLLNAELEQRVRRRTAELEAANKELEGFAYTVAHDLRGPLVAVDGLVSLLQSQHAAQLPPEGQHFLDLVRQSAKRMGQLIDDLLRFAKTASLPVQRQDIDLTTLVHACIDEFRDEIERRRIAVTVRSLPRCAADPTLLRQVFINLIGNAVKYTRQQAQASIDIGSEEVDGERVVHVKDNGVGFDMKYIDKLFGAFQRLHRQDEFEGTGVGLAIVQRIVQRHGGRIWAEAKPKRGASFYLTLGVDASTLP
jgi:two-component system sensor histidine kinase/response regulator